MQRSGEKGQSGADDGSGLREPRTHGGLLAAFEAARRGDQAALARWYGTAGARILHQLIAHGLPAAHARDLLDEAVAKIWLRTAEGVEVSSERACLTTGIRFARLDELRERTAPAGMPVEHLPAPPSIPPGEDREGFECLRATLLQAIATLPPPYLQIQQLRLADHDLRHVKAYLRAWRPVSDETCRGLIQRANGMLRAALAGFQPVRLFPGAFSKKNPWFLPPPV